MAKDQVLSHALAQSKAILNTAKNAQATIVTYNVKPSTTPCTWADTPYKLIMKPQTDKKTASVHMATEMGSIHNIIIRGINSIVLQAPYVPDSSQPSYNAQDVADLLFFVRAWCENLDHHHHVEETTFFPLVEEATGIPGLMDELEAEHEEFHGGVVRLQEYVEKVHSRPEEYRWSLMKAMIESFAAPLINHLHAEIDFLLELNKYASDEALMRCWTESGKVAEKIEDPSVFFDLFPFMLGQADKTYDGGNNFPPVPKPILYAVKHVLSRKHKGAWRFNSCDYFGKPKALEMIPEVRNE